MIDANEKKWVDEAEKEFIDFYGASPKSETFKQYFIQGAVLTRKKAHSGNVDAFKAFTLDLADRYEKEIEKLKEEIDLFTEALSREAEITDHLHSEIEKRDKLLEQSYVTMKYFACVSDEIIERKDAEQWLTKAENIRVEG